MYEKIAFFAQLLLCNILCIISAAFKLHDIGQMPRRIMVCSG